MIPSTRPLPHVDGVTHSHRRAGDVTLHVAEAGEGPPVVLLHGWPQHWYEWRDVIGPLAEERRVIAPDLRGFGWSDAPPGDYRLEQLARDMLALLDEMEVEEFDLAGHDWGGFTGYLMCLFAPERVRHFLALNIAHPFGRATLATLTTGWRFWYQGLLAAPALGPSAMRGRSPISPLLAYWTGASRAWDAEEREAFLSQFDEPARVRATQRLYRTFVTRQAPKMAGGAWRRQRLRTPTHALYGTGDHIVRPVHVEGAEPYADRLTVEHVPGVGHFIVDERPELVVARARELFGRD